jgi:hypothetical protein
VNLDAVFEATPYRPGADGRFHSHEEASGFAVHGAATLDQTRRRAVEVMAGYRRPWWVAGGWALDLVLGHKTRPHADLEIAVLAGDQQALFDHLPGWDLRGRTDRWVFRRHAGVSRLLREVDVITASGVPVVAPEIALLFKASAPRFKDQRDFDRVLPHLDRAARSWLPRPWSKPIPATPGTRGCSRRRRDRDR